MTDISDRAHLQMVKVTNRNGFTMNDRFDGVPYTFRPNQPESIPPQAANHFFGWPGDEEDMKRHTCRRFGWNQPGHIGADRTKQIDEMIINGKNLADVYWGNLTLECVNFTVVEAPKDDMPEVPEGDDEDSSKPALPDMSEPSGTRTGTRIRTPRKINV